MRPEHARSDTRPLANVFKAGAGVETSGSLSTGSQAAGARMRIEPRREFDIPQAAVPWLGDFAMSLHNRSLQRVWDKAAACPAPTSASFPALRHN